MNKWIVHVTDFGKIEKADVQVSPLTLFVGDNNSGKSYMMTLIYGLLYLDIFFQKYKIDTGSAAFLKCCEMLDRMFELDEDGENTYILSEEEMGSLQELLNQTLQKNKKRFLRNLFNREMQIGQLWLEFPGSSQYKFEIEYMDRIGENGGGVSLRGSDRREKHMSGYAMEMERLKEEGSYQFFLSYIMEYMIKKGFEGMGRSLSAYFPTARTGFLLTYKTLVGSAMQDKFNVEEDKNEKNLLTRPNSDFLTRLSSMSTQRQNEEYQSIVEFIEKRVINGHIAVSDLPAHDILYVPEGGGKELPMFVTSGVVTELTPILLFLQYQNIRTMLIEEPEISLHPQLQWQMARVLIRLKNAGIPVFVTTHSDIILQHINNMLKASKLSDREEFLKNTGYDKEDLLECDEVAVYQFDVKENQKTRVTRLACGDYGFEAMTFYNTLEKLNQQICEIENMEE